METKTATVLKAAIQAHTALYDAGYRTTVNYRDGETATVKTFCSEIEITVAATPSDDVNAEIWFGGRWVGTVPACSALILEKIERCMEAAEKLVQKRLTGSSSRAYMILSEAKEPTSQPTEKAE